MGCILGARKCFGSNLYECHYDPYSPPNTTWVLVEANAPQCVEPEPPPPPEPEPTFHLSISVPSWATGGYVEPGSGDYPAYETIILTAHPLDGYQFTSWGGDASGTSRTYNLYMNSNKNVEAYFEPVSVSVEGTIETIELEHDGQQAPIPVVATIGEQGRINVWAKNTSVTPQRLGIHWTVIDPQSAGVSEYTDWETGDTQPGETHHFWDPDRFDINKGGTWWVGIELWIGLGDDYENNFVIVDANTFLLCTVEVLAGSIERQWLEYHDNDGDIPHPDPLPTGWNAKIHVIARNDMDTKQTMGVWWLVRNSAGAVVEQHQLEWEAMASNSTHEFISPGDFPLDMAGEWTIEILLFMNPDTPVQVAHYDGRLAIVEGYVAQIAEMILKYDSVPAGANIPVTAEVPLGERGEVSIRAVNQTSFRQRMAISWVIKDPDGLLFESYISGFSIMIDPGDQHEFEGDFHTFFKEGLYTIDIGLFLNPPDPTQVDSWSGNLCTVGEGIEPPPPNGEPPPKEKEFPWIPVALIGGGAVVVAATMIPKKPKT